MWHMIDGDRAALGELPATSRTFPVGWNLGGRVKSGQSWTGPDHGPYASVNVLESLRARFVDGGRAVLLHERAHAEQAADDVFPAAVLWQDLVDDHGFTAEPHGFSLKPRVITKQGGCDPDHAASRIDARCLAA